MAPRLRLALLALIAGLYLVSCDREKDPEPEPQPPATPTLFNIDEIGNNWIEFSWHYPYNDESGFYLYSHTGDTAWARIDTVPASNNQTVRFTATGLLPGTVYYFRVTSFNANGESLPSTARAATTTGILPPEPPVNVHAVAINANFVRVGWTAVGTSDGFRLERRIPTTPWLYTATAGPSDTALVDSFANALTTYYYRVGSMRGSLVVWAADSAAVTTPDGPPLAPENVQTQAHIGIGIRITWEDLSTNELGFQIGRRYEGGELQIVGTAAADAESYLDTLGNATGIYLYSIRSYNAIGESGWIAAPETNYRLCSGGVIPLCVGNWWRYDVSVPGAPDYIFRREVRGFQLINNQDYYIVTDSITSLDTLYYLRNNVFGCVEIDYPLVPNPEAEVLYPYPAQPGHYTWVDGDCVLVAGTSGVVIIGQTVYTNLYVYQRFYTDTSSVQIYVRPNTLGIVREQEIVNGTFGIRRDILEYQVLN